MNNFLYGERLIGKESDNEIIYFAGPLKISICGWTELITIKSNNSKWDFLLKECLETAKQAWELDESNEITINQNEITIKYNFKNLKLYIEHNILFI